MNAALVLRQRAELDANTFFEIVVWRLPRPLAGSRHDYKYRLALVSDNICVLRFDNEAGKGDHKHLDGLEVEYSFEGIDQLLTDFFGEIERWRLK
ncbi:MAG: DUF6516 family protein [Novosphingobium sp.]